MARKATPMRRGTAAAKAALVKAPENSQNSGQCWRKTCDKTQRGAERRSPRITLVTSNSVAGAVIGSGLFKSGGRGGESACADSREDKRAGSSQGSAMG